MTGPIKKSFGPNTQMRTSSEANPADLTGKKNHLLLDALNKQMGISESNEISTNLPLDVAIQEAKAISFFEKNNEPNNLKVVAQVKKLRESGGITYENFGGGKYIVSMPCGSKQLKMEFPPNITLSDISASYTGFADENIINKEVKPEKLWGEKNTENIISEADFKILIHSLYPEGIQKEQILAFMMATGFYGWMWLKGQDGRANRAVKCACDSSHRIIEDMFWGHPRLKSCSLVIVS